MGGIFVVFYVSVLKTDVSLVGGLVVTSIATTLSVYLGRRFIDKRSFVSLGLNIKKRMIADFLYGFFVAAIIIAIVYFIEWKAGWIQYNGLLWNETGLNKALISVGAMLLVFLFVGWQEEVLFRGYILQNCTEGVNLFWGVVFSSLIFATIHILNPHYSLAPLIGLFIAGSFLAYPYVLSRQLWISIGLHAGWNFFEGTVFGFQVSGLDHTPSIILQTVNGPALLTGGAFGPEAGLVILPGLLVGCLLISIYVRNSITQSNKNF